MSGQETDTPRVLVIDDEDSIRDACRQVLTKNGWEVLTAADGEEGLDLAAQTRPQVILVDMKMPKLAGLAVLDELEEANPDSVSVVISAYATVSTALQALRQGAFDFLPKPFTPEELRLVTDRALECYQQHQADQALLRTALADLEELKRKLAADSPEGVLAEQVREALLGYQGEDG